MMRLKFFFGLSILLFHFLSYSQVPAQGDTIETIITDTSITYIVRKPVTIVEKIEIAIARKKKKIYLSIGASILHCYDIRKASSGYEEYTRKVNSSIKNAPGYSIGVVVWTSPKKLYKGFSASLQKLNQQFQVSDQQATQFLPSFKYTLRFTYAEAGIQAGYWFRKPKKISLIVFGGISVQKLLSYSGFMYDKGNLNSIQHLYLIMSYKNYIPNFSVHSRFLLDLKNHIVELEPHFTFIPTSITAKKEVYSEQRSFLGLRIGISHKLF